MKKRGLDVHIHLTNRWLYTLIVIGILIGIGVGVYALNPGVKPNPGHNYTEIAPCAEGQILKVVGGVWKCTDLGTTETDPTVKSWAKTDYPSVPGNITTFGAIRTAKQYKYTSSMWSSGHTKTPRCPCDISTNGRDCLNIWYTNTDSGATCYDYWYATSGYALGPGNVQSPHTRSSGPFIINTYS